MSGFDVSMVLGRILGSAPLLLVMVGGLAVCLIRDTRPLRVRVLVGTAIAMQMFNVIVMPVVYTLMIAANQQSGGGVGGLSMQIQLLSLFGSSISGVALALLLWAAFTNDDLPTAT
jgi:hypothetical protein